MMSPLSGLRWFQRILFFTNEYPIHVIGDSHATFFSGMEYVFPYWPHPTYTKLTAFRVYHIGPVLAYSLSKTGTTQRGREKLFEILTTLPKSSRVLLSFGEIDCRVHLVKQAEKQGKSLKDLSADCARTYFGVVREIEAMGFRPMVWNVVPTTNREDLSEEDYPAYGTERERNECTKHFNETLEQLCASQRIPFISIFKLLLKARGDTNYDLYFDRIHLSVKAVPMMEEALQRAGVRYVREGTLKTRASNWMDRLVFEIPVFMEKLYYRLRRLRGNDA